MQFATPDSRRIQLFSLFQFILNSISQKLIFFLFFSKQLSFETYVTIFKFSTNELTHKTLIYFHFFHIDPL